MMELTDDLLNEITRMAAVAFTARQTAFALGIKPSLFMQMMQDEDSPVCIAYYKGLNSSECALRESIMLLARSGSSPAQTAAVKLFEETRKTMRKDGIAEEDQV